jgi:hypothetical protein
MTNMNKKSLFVYVILYLLIGLSMLLTTCGNLLPTGKEYALVRISLGGVAEPKSAAPRAVPELVDSFQLTVSADNMESVELSFADSFIELDVPAGTARTFTLTAFDARGVRLYTGSATEDLIGGSETTIPILLKLLIPAPLRMEGTIAFGETSGTIDIVFPQELETGQDMASLPLSGSIHYSGQDFPISGSFDSYTGILNVSAAGSLGADIVEFIIEYTYSPGDDSSGGTIVMVLNSTTRINGSISLIAIFAEDEDVTKYLGTASGYIQWTVSTQGATMTGAWANAYDPDSFGILAGTVSGNILNMDNIGEDGESIGRGVGTLDGDTMYGTYHGEDLYGYSSGKKTDANGVRIPNADSDPAEYKLTRILEAINNGLLQVDFSTAPWPDEDGEDETYQNGDGSVQYRHYISSSYGYAEITFSNFIDEITGLTINGTWNSEGPDPQHTTSDMDLTADESGLTQVVLTADFDSVVGASSVTFSSAVITLDGIPLDINILEYLFLEWSNM